MTDLRCLFSSRATTALCLSCAGALLAGAIFSADLEPIIRAMGIGAALVIVCLTCCCNRLLGAMRAHQK